MFELSSNTSLPRKHYKEVPPNKQYVSLILHVRLHSLNFIPVTNLKNSNQLA